jgi:cyclase
MDGYDMALVKVVTQAVGIPVVACGGAGTLEDVRAVVVGAGASAAAVGSLFVFHGPHRAVLISYPDRRQATAIFS